MFSCYLTYPRTLIGYEYSLPRAFLLETGGTLIFKKFESPFRSGSKRVRAFDFMLRSIQKQIHRAGMGYPGRVANS